MKVKIKSFNGKIPNYLTEDKEYQVIASDGKGFEILDDMDEWLYTRFEDSYFLNGGDWEIVE